jgi:hypothetical protein
MKQNMLETWRKRYWLGGASLAIFLIVATVMNPWLPPAKQVNRQTMGLDFVSFYTAGSFARQGRVNELYDLPALRTFQQKLASRNHLDLHDAAPWWNPPIYAVAFEPFSAMSFNAARWTWLAINLVCLAAAIALLMQMLPADCHWSCRALVPLLICVSMPAIQAIGHAQNSAISLLILTAAVTLAQKRRPLLAGLVIALLLYKPQIALAFAAILTLCYGWRLLTGFTIAGVTTLLLNVLLLPGTLLQYIWQLPANLHAIQFAHAYIWERQITLGGFWHLLLQGRGPSSTTPAVFILTLAFQAFLAAGLIYAFWKTRGDRTQFLIAAFTATPLVMPYFLDYDLLLLAVPVTLYAARVMKNPPKNATAIWTAFYACLLFNPPLGRLTHINFAVLALCATTTAMITAFITQSRTGKIAAELRSADKAQKLAA